MRLLSVFVLEGVQAALDAYQLKCGCLITSETTICTLGLLTYSPKSRMYILVVKPDGTAQAAFTICPALHSWNKHWLC